MKTEFRLVVKSLCLSLVASFCLLSYGMSQTIEERLVPAKVKSSFARSVPSAQVQWSQGIKNQYQAHFNRGGQPYVYVYTTAGALMEKKMLTSQLSLPTQVKSALEQKYSHPIVEDAFRVINRNKQKYFEIVVVNTTNKEYLQYNTRGNLIASFEEPLANRTTMASTKESSFTPASPTAKKDDLPKDETIAATTQESSNQPLMRGEIKEASSQPLMRGEVKETAKTTQVLKEEDYFNDDDLYDLDEEDEFKDDLDDLLKDDNSDFDADFGDFDILDDDEDDDLLDPGFE